MSAATRVSIRPLVLLNQHLFLGAEGDFDIMNAIAPFSRSGSCLLANAALRADTISALEWPAITIFVRRSAIGNFAHAAWRSP